MGNNSNIKAVTDDEFDNFIRDNEYVLVDLWADWCVPCKMVEPALESLAEKYSDKVRFAKLDIQENPNTPNKYGIQAIPAMLFFCDGNLVGQGRGALPESQIEEMLYENFDI